MKSRPFTSFRTPAKLLPTALSMTSVVMLVMVAGASVIFSARRDADTTTPASETVARVSVTSTRVSSPGRTTTPVTDFACSPMRCTRTSYVPASTPLIVKRPPASVVAPCRVPTTPTCAPAMGALVESVTVPLMRPACASAAAGPNATNNTPLNKRQLPVKQPEMLMTSSPLELSELPFSVPSSQFQLPIPLSVDHDNCLPFHHRLAILIATDCRQPQAPFRRHDLHHFHPRRHRVTNAHRLREAQRLAQVDRARAGEPHRDHGRDEPGTQHPVRDALPEPRLRRGDGIHVDGIEVTRHACEQRDVRLRHRLRHLGGLSDLELVDARHQTSITRRMSASI